MSKSDVDMEDAEKLSRELGDNVQDPECKSIVSNIESKRETDHTEADIQGNADKNEIGVKDVTNVDEPQCKPLVERKGETVLPDADIQENANKNEIGVEDVTKVDESQSKLLVESKEETVLPEADIQENASNNENGVGDVNTITDNAHDKVTVSSEVEDQSRPSSEAVEPIVDVTPVAALVNVTSENVGLIFAETNRDESTAGGSTVEEQTETVIEHDEQSTMDTDNGLKKENHVNIMEKQTETDNLESQSGNHLEDTEEKSSADIVDEVSEDNKRPDQDSFEHLAGEESTMAMETDDAGNEPSVISHLPADISGNKAAEESRLPDEIPLVDNKESENAADSDEKKAVIDELEEPGNDMSASSPVTNKKSYAIESVTSAKHDNDDSSRPNQQEHATRSTRVRYSPSMNGNQSTHAVKTGFTQAAVPLMGESDDGTPEEQSAFIKELESFYRERGMDFKTPKFYGKPLNCLKLWRSVIRLGCYDRVTGSKLWRQVGESFHPPKTCTTVSFTFRVFYEKSLLEFERHKKQRGELQLPLTTLHDESGVDNEVYGNNQGSGSVTGRARRDAAARAMQGWHVQRVLDNGEVGQPVIKDKYPNDTAKREKNLRNIGPIKQKRSNEVENSIKVARTDAYNQLETTVVDIGPPADWVKINIRQTKDCFEVYALVPGLLREEVRVQSDPAGRLVITGHPEQVDNPWGITPFKKVVSLPARIDPLQTSAIVSLHGRLFIRVPFEQSNV